MHSFIDKNLQTILNHYLALDPESKTRLAALQNKIVHIELVHIKQILQLQFMSDEIIITSRDFLTPHTTIRGTPLSLLHMSLRPSDKRKQFFAEDVSIKGEIELGQKVIELFDALEIDWEEYLSHWIGDIPAHQTGRLVRKIKNFSTHFRHTLLQNVNEYTHEEINLFPPREEIEDFFAEIDTLRSSMDRLEARIASLAKLIKGDN